MPTSYDRLGNLESALDLTLDLLYTIGEAYQAFAEDHIKNHCTLNELLDRLHNDIRAEKAHLAKQEAIENLATLQDVEVEIAYTETRLSNLKQKHAYYLKELTKS